MTADMAKTINNIATQTPKVVAKSATRRFSVPDRGDGLSAVVEAETKIEAKEKATKLHKKYSGTDEKSEANE